MIGRTISHYRVLSKLGAGGMGDVYVAEDTRLDRKVAIKVLPAEFTRNAESVSRFIQEAKAASALNHPNIITVHDVGESSEGRFIVMELVSGRTLRSMAGTDKPLASLLPLFSQMARAIAAAHAAGITHRDVKPENIMVRGDGYVKVLDFGLARLSPVHGGDAEAAATRLTEFGLVMGTIKYMSPEQASGQTVGPPTDIYSLGMVFYELIAGRYPFSSDTAVGYLHAITLQTTPPLEGIPKTLAALITRMLDKDAARRPAADEVQRELDTIEKSSFPPVLAATANDRRGTSWKWAAAVALAVILAVAIYLFIRPGSSTSTSSAIRSIAVLPLDNYSGDDKQEYFAEGMTDELTATLANISQLRVISRGSAMQFKGSQRPATPVIGRTLNVDAIVEGSVLRSGDKVRITIQLIDARDDRHVWAKSFERTSGDVLALQDELASTIANEIHVQLTPAEKTRLAAARRVNPAAYDAYLKGRYFFNRPNDENLAKAISQFEEAVALDPNFAPAYSGMSDAYLWAGYNEGFLTATEARPKAKAAAERAVQLDGNSAEGHTSLAVFKLFYEYDWEGSEAAFRQAIALNPNYAFAHDQFALLLAFQLRTAESIAESRRATELDPLSPLVWLDTIPAVLWERRFQDAKDLAKRSSELDPSFFFPVWVNGWIDIEAGMVPEAIPDLLKAKSMNSPAFVGAWLGYAYAASGDRVRAQAELDELKSKTLRGYVSPFNLAVIYLGLGDRERALSYLEQAYTADSQWLGWLKGDRIFDPLRSDPRFVALMKKLRFEK
jgi:eukaryotic-like serine/threonine-protein kinase